jgi:hypothetical protein
VTTRVQTLRSSTTGNVPAAGTRQPGELWTNFPDLQLGVIDATKTAQKLVAVRFFSTQANYATNDIVVQAGAIYIAKGAVTAGAFVPANWSKLAQLTDIPVVYVLPTASTTVLGGVKIDGTTVKIDGGGVISSAGLVAVATTPPVSPQNGSLWFDLVGGQLYAYVNDGTSSQWVIAVNQSLGGVYLPMSGGTLTGPLTLAADPVNPLDAATKRYADTAPTLGVTNGSDAAAGQIGEVISSVVASPGVTLTTSVVANVTSISLTPGDWDVQGEIRLDVSVSATVCTAGISNVSATVPAQSIGATRSILSASLSAGAQIFALRTCRVSLAAAATYYLIASATFPSGTATSSGVIWARRAR